MLNVTIIDDDIPEDNKNFTLAINPSSLHRHVNVGNLSQATVTIMDNDDGGDGNINSICLFHACTVYTYMLHTLIDKHMHIDMYICDWICQNPA